MNWLKKAQVYETPQNFQDPGNLPEFISGPPGPNPSEPWTEASEDIEKGMPDERLRPRIKQLILEKEWEVIPSEEADFIEIENLHADIINDNYIYDVLYHVYDEKKDSYETRRERKSWDKSVIDSEVNY